jgi:hypothetical protein
MQLRSRNGVRLRSLGGGKQLFARLPEQAGANDFDAHRDLSRSTSLCYAAHEAFGHGRARRRF